MTPPRASVVRFVKVVVRAEFARSDAGSHSDLAQRIVARLYQQLGRLIGPAGFDVLLARALVLARRAHPFLAGITAGPGGTLAGLDAVARDDAGHEEAATVIASHFIELLVRLVGEDLAMRLVRDSWSVGDDEEEEVEK
jgi:hypothetical protein